MVEGNICTYKRLCTHTWLMMVWGWKEQIYAYQTGIPGGFELETPQTLDCPAWFVLAEIFQSWPAQQELTYLVVINTTSVMIRGNTNPVGHVWRVEHFYWTHNRKHRSIHDKYVEGILTLKILELHTGRSRTITQGQHQYKGTIKVCIVRFEEL